MTTHKIGDRLARAEADNGALLDCDVCGAPATVTWGDVATGESGALCEDCHDRAWAQREREVR